MQITYKDYVLIPADVCKDRFDLYKKGVYETGNNIGKDKQTIIGYGYRFEDAIEKIIRLEVANNESVTTLREYVTEYRQLVSEARSLLSGGMDQNDTKVSVII